MGIVNTIEKYFSEMQAEGAWSGHEYAFVYLSEIRDALKTYFTDTVADYEYKDGYLYKSGKLCISGPNTVIWETAHHGQYKLREDYAYLLNELYNAGLSQNDRYDIAEAMNEQFKRNLAEAVDVAYVLLKYTDKNNYEALRMYFEE